MRVRLISVKVNQNQEVGMTIASAKTTPGAYRVHSIEPNSPAQQAGFLENDYILQVSGKSICIMEYNEVMALIKAKKEENDLEFLVTRDLPLFSGL